MALIARSLQNITLDAPAHRQSLAQTRAAAPGTEPQPVETQPSGLETPIWILLILHPWGW